MRTLQQIQQLYPGSFPERGLTPEQTAQSRRDHGDQAEQGQRGETSQEHAGDSFDQDFTSRVVA